jgi:hypothetical protein
MNRPDCLVAGEQIRTARILLREMEAAGSAGQHGVI